MNDNEQAPFIHVSRENAQWIFGELKEWWDVSAGDSLHYTYHMTSALMELSEQLGYEVD